MRLEDTADAVVGDGEIALPIGVAGVEIGQPPGDCEGFGEGAQRGVELAPRLADVAKQVAGAPLPPRIARGDRQP